MENYDRLKAQKDRIVEQEAKALWERLCLGHLRPSVVFSLAVGLQSPSQEETTHLEACEECRRWLKRYQDEQASV